MAAGDATEVREPESTDARQEESGEIDITPSAESPPEEPDHGAAPPVRWWELAAYVALLLAAAASRLWDLGSRAVHHDESLHAYYSWILSNGSGYTHDPMMHGPFQFEATAAVFLVLGDSDYTSRLVYAVAGIALVAMPFLLRRRMGRLGALFASAMLTASPAILYFSRFSRNDILMAVWTLGLVACAWRYIDEGKNRYLYTAAALLALAFATKETAFIISAVFGTFLLAQARTAGASAHGSAYRGRPDAHAASAVDSRPWSLACHRAVSWRAGHPRGNAAGVTGDVDAATVGRDSRAAAGHPATARQRPGAGQPGGISCDRRPDRRRLGDCRPSGRGAAGGVGLRGRTVEVAHLVALRGHLLHDMGAAVLHVPDEPGRPPHGSLEVAGLLDCAAGRGARQPALALLLRHHVALRVSAAALGAGGRRLLLHSPVHGAFRRCEV